MASSVDFGNLEQSVERLVASGRYSSKSEVLREGVRLVEERDKLHEVLNAALTSRNRGRGRGPREVRERGIQSFDSQIWIPRRAKGE